MSPCSSARWIVLGAPLLGRWSDRFGRRRILLASQLGTFFTWLVFVACFFLLVVGGVLFGLLGARAFLLAAVLIGVSWVMLVTMVMIVRPGS